jgi:hypothetical protein
MHRAVNGKIEKEKEDDGFECAVGIRLGGSSYFFGDWTGYFCVHCLHSLLCCFFPQCQGSLLVLPTIQFKVNLVIFFFIVSLLLEEVVQKEI